MFFFPHIVFLSDTRTIKIGKLHVEDVQGLDQYL